MKWFSNWIYKQYQKGRDLNEDSIACESPRLKRDSYSIDARGMNFTIHRADGGHVVEMRVYDRKRDENEIKLHVITDDKDLGEELGKIITFSNLRS